MIEKTHPTNDPIRRDSQLESVSQTDDVVEDDRGEQLDNASLEDKTYNTLEKDPEVILESEKLLPEVSGK